MSTPLRQRLGEPVDLASRVFFRIGFGLLAAGESYRLLSGGHAAALWIEPGGFFPWPGLAWLAPHGGDWVHVQLYAQVLLGLAIAAGLFHRAACVLLAVGCASLLVRDQAAFLSQLQLIGTLALLLAATPAERALSLETWLRPRHRADDAPAWSLWLLRGQLAIVLFCIGFWMLDGDWLRGYPLRLWLPDRPALPLLGRASTSPGFAVGLAWALAAVHLASPALLVWRPSRPWALVALGIALLWIAESFRLGAWPWLLLLGATLFLEPDWPRQVFRWPRTAPPRAEPTPRWLPAAAGLWLLLQLALPLRGLALPGSVAWHGVGDLGAWRPFHASKEGAIHFVIRDAPTGRERKLQPREIFSERQVRRLATSPALARHYARRLAARDGTGPRSVYAVTLVTLNGREPQRLIDPRVDLSREPLPEGWILPMKVPVDRQWRVEDASSPPAEELRAPPPRPRTTRG